MKNDKVLHMVLFILLKGKSRKEIEKEIIGKKTKIRWEIAQYHFQFSIFLYFIINVNV